MNLSVRRIRWYMYILYVGESGGGLSAKREESVEIESNNWIVSNLGSPVASLCGEGREGENNGRQRTEIIVLEGCENGEILQGEKIRYYYYTLSLKIYWKNFDACAQLSQSPVLYIYFVLNALGAVSVSFIMATDRFRRTLRAPIFPWWDGCFLLAAAQFYVTPPTSRLAWTRWLFKLSQPRLVSMYLLPSPHWFSSCAFCPLFDAVCRPVQSSSLNLRNRALPKVNPTSISPLCLHSSSRRHFTRILQRTMTGHQLRSHPMSVLSLVEIVPIEPMFFVIVRPVSLPKWTPIRNKSIMQTRALQDLIRHNSD